jgi:hypothetical protein
MGYKNALVTSRLPISQNAAATTASLLLAIFLLTSRFQPNACTLKGKCNRWRGGGANGCMGLLSVASVYKVVFMISLGGFQVTSKYLILGPISLHHLAAGVPFPKIWCAVCVKVKVRHALRAEYILIITAWVASDATETWSLTLREERRLRVFENRVLTRIFGATKDERTRRYRQWGLERRGM